MHFLIRYTVLSFILALVIVVPASAQNTCPYTLSGKVIDEHDGQALPYANIYIQELGIGAVSDEKGYYKIEKLCKGTYTVRCSHVGCESITNTITINKNVSHNFYPEHHAELLKEANIIADKVVEKPTQSMQTISEKELTKTTGKTLGDILTQVTGVNTLSTGNNITKPVIHGLHSNRILIMNNGIRQEGQQWGNEHAPEIDPFIADELTVIKGANSVRYGPDAIAGVILVQPKPLRNTQGIDGELNLVGFSNGKMGIASAKVDGNFNKVPALSWRAQGTYKRGGNVKAPNYYLKNSGLKEYNYSWAAAYSLPNKGVEIFYSQFNTDIGIFSASHIGNLSDLKKAFEAAEPLESADFTYAIDRPLQHIEHELVKAKAFIATGNAGRLSITYARQYNKRLEYDKHKPLNDSLAALNRPELQFEITSHTSDLIWEHHRYKSFKGSFGVSAIHQSNTHEGRFFIPNFRKLGAGVFWIERWKPLESKLELEAGIRYDHFFQEIFIYVGDEIVSPEKKYSNLSGTIGALYKINDKVNISANAGTAWRPPNVNEIYSNGLHHGAAAVEIGDTTLLPEQAYNFSCAFEYTNKHLQLNVDAYYNYIHQFIYLKPVLPPTLTIRGAFPTFHYSQVNATLKGIDLTASFKLPFHFSYTAKASLLRARNISKGEHLVLMPADRFENSLEYSWSKPNSDNTAFIAIKILNVLKQWRVPANSDFVKPPNAYTLLSIQGGTNIRLREQTMTIGLSIENVFNTKYRDYLNRFRYYTDELGTNLSVRLTVPFTILKSKNN